MNQKLHYGAAYYLEYVPEERLEEDVRLIREAGFTVVRIGESTWSTWEPQDNEFDFRLLRRMLEAFTEAGIAVICGTPTYAFPAWLAKKHPEVFAETGGPPHRYGARQIMDITSPAFRFHAERIIRRFCAVCAEYPAVIGWQLDNETKHYGTSGPAVQAGFVKWLQERFGQSLEKMNEAYGFNYWSNRISDWEDFPDPRGTINASLSTAFKEYQRGLVTDYLAWQKSLVDEYRREDQFITHNTDFDWRGHSYGLQGEVNHYETGRLVDVAACDIYHPSQDKLTGLEISLCGDLCRGSKQQRNYMVMETQAQGFPQWTPFPGQLQLQALSHLASGASMVSYWHWSSLHNACETYWKGVLSHSLKPGRTYREVQQTAKVMKKLEAAGFPLTIQSRVAILVSQRSYDALDRWPAFPLPSGERYNDVVNWLYNTLYKANIRCDMLYAEDENLDLSPYSVVAVPALYSAGPDLLETLKEYAENGGSVLMTFRSGFANENMKVYSEEHPAILNEVFGVAYDEFLMPQGVSLEAVNGQGTGDLSVKTWMELLTAGEGTEVLYRYRHPAWEGIPAIVLNRYGQGKALYLGTWCSEEVLLESYERLIEGIEGVDGDTGSRIAALSPDRNRFPVIVKRGRNTDGLAVSLYFNYSMETQEALITGHGGRNALGAGSLGEGQAVTLEPWGQLVVIKE